MADYVKQFFKSKRRKTDSTSEETDSQHQRPTSSNSSGPSGASTSSSSAAFLSPSSTANSMDYILGTMSTTMSPSTSTSTSVFGLRRGQAPTGLAVAGGVGHRRQHSSLSAGHLQQHQQEVQSRHAATIARIAKRREHIEEPFDPTERPPKFRQRSPYYKSVDQLQHSDMRMLLIEAESRVLYDTLTVIPVKDGIHPLARGKSSCGQFQFLKHRKDTKKLSQMIFGAVPNMRGNESFRIHMLEDEEMILVSRTFSIPKQKKGLPESLKARVADPTSSDSDSQSTVKSLDGWRTRTSNSVMSTPESFSRVRHVSITFGEEGGESDSHNQYGGSPGSSYSLPRGFSPPHRLSKARRRQMAVTTSLSETSAFPIPSSLKSRSRMSSMSSTQADEEFQPHNMRNVALAILVPMPQKYFLMQHIPLVESEMSRLETRIINASGHSATFLQNVSKSWDEVTEVICQLHNAPRLKHPYWLALNEACQLDGKTLAVEFCEHLTYLVRRYDRKEAGYFLSNLITALLMHHLSWIASVATPPRVTDTTNPQANMLFGMGQAEGAPTVGYNALMAQYLEIAGACGTTKSAKICILGDDVEILASVIAVLSFFIRCSAVKHVEDERMWEVPAEQPFSPIDVSGSPTTLPGCPHHHQNPNNLPAQPPGNEAVGHSVTLHHPHPEETSSVAMMRRLRNNNQATTQDDNQPTSSAAAALRDAQEAASEAEGALVPRSEGVVANPVDFPCCPTFFEDKDMWAPRPNPEGLGRSMFAGPVDNYCQHFVLSGVIRPNANMPDVYSRMFDEVKCTDSPSHRSYTSTVMHHQSVVSSSSQSTSSMSEPLNPENVLIVADLENLTVKVLSSEGSDEVTSPSESVVGMLEQFVGIHDAIPTTAEFLVGMIEDCLAHVVGKSLTLVELVRSEQTSSSPQLTPERVRSIIGCDHSDLRLIVNVAAVYWPPVLQSVLG